MLVYWLVTFFMYPWCVFGAKTLPSVTNLEIDKTITYVSQQNIGFFTSDLRVYCYEGIPKYLTHLFQSLNLELDIDNDDFVLYEGTSPENVQIHYENQRSIFSFNLLNTNKRKLVKLNPFNQTCVGIDTAHPYMLRLNVIRIDFWKVTLLLIGIFVFWSAKRLSETPLFYYLTGILLGVFASFLVVVYFVSKLFPKRPMMYGVMVGGWTLGVYFAQILWDNLQMIFMTYQSYVFWYIVVTGFISFIICYRLGPPQNQRSKNIIKWGLQFSSLIMIYFSSHYKEAAIGINIFMILLFYFPKSLIIKTKGLWIRHFPPKKRLLTNEEYYEQAAKETKKALDELKNYCSSPESKPWKTMLKLKDPHRFASFIEGSSHILDEEVLEYETFRAEISDDSDNDSDNNNYGQQQHHHQSQNTMNRLKNSYSNSNGHISSNMIRNLQTSTPIEERSNQNRRRYIPPAVEFSDDD